MRAERIEPARLARDERALPYSPLYGDVYHPAVGAWAQAAHVFLAGNDLPRRWQGRGRYTILETGFGLGNNFLATCDAWQRDPQRCERLTFVSIERHPLTREDLRAVHADTPSRTLVDALIAQWPLTMFGLHRLVFDGGRIELLLAFGDVQAWLPELRVQADAYYLDGHAPARNPRMWDERVCKALGRLAAPNATLATWSAASALRRDLTSAGFEVRAAPGIGGKRDITLARHAPHPTQHARPAQERPADRRALVIGGGLAGCAAAWALAEHGWQARIVERHPGLAGGASGNPAGLFHPIVHAQDGVHARLHRAAAFEACRAVGVALREHGAAGGLDGVLRLDPQADSVAMRAMIEALGAPAGHVQALDAAHAGALAGMRLAAPAWFFPGAGWIDPAAYARAFVARAGAAATVAAPAEVARIERVGALWHAFDAAGRTIDAAPVLVLANAQDAARLAPPAAAATWALRPVRGQLSWIDAARAAPWRVRLPVAGAGYLLPPVAGRIVFGATSAADDTDASVRDADHRENVAQIERLTGSPLMLAASELGGRTAWRCTTPDRLPLIGAVPAGAGGQAPHDRLRRVAREPGLYVYTGLGSRGIGWAALGARVLAAAIDAAPMPLEASLLEAIDPARFGVRAARRAAG